MDPKLTPKGPTLTQHAPKMVPKWVPKPPKMGKMTIFEKLIGLERSFLFLSHPLSSNIFKHWLPHNLALVVSKWVPEPPKMGKSTIFEKLKGLER